MMILKNILRKGIRFLSYKNTFDFITDEVYLKILYWACFGKKLNLREPASFNEKLQWLKLHDRNPIYTTIVDKYEVKKYVASLIGEKFIIPTIDVYDCFENINFDFLPNRFVLKTTHDSGGIVICHNKNNFDKVSAKLKLNKSLRRDYYKTGREWPYKNVKPRIIAEEYMVDSKLHELRDYKFFCFNGKIKFFKVDFDRFSHHRANYYDVNGNLMNFGEVVCPPDPRKNIILPKTLHTMIQFAELLASDIPFLRVDFYDVDGHIYFGEMTFYPASGFGEFIPEEWDLKIGKLLRLPCTEYM